MGRSCRDSCCFIGPLRDNRGSQGVHNKSGFPLRCHVQQLRFAAPPSTLLLAHGDRRLAEFGPCAWNSVWLVKHRRQRRIASGCYRGLHIDHSVWLLRCWRVASDMCQDIHVVCSWSPFPSNLCRSIHVACSRPIFGPSYCPRPHDLLCCRLRSLRCSYCKGIRLVGSRSTSVAPLGTCGWCQDSGRSCKQLRHSGRGN